MGGGKRERETALISFLPATSGLTVGACIFLLLLFKRLENTMLVVNWYEDEAEGHCEDIESRNESGRSQA